MSERRTVKTVLQYEVDQQSVKNAQASATQVERALKGIDTDFSRLGSKVGSRVNQLRDGFRNDIRTVRDELELVQGVLSRGGSNGTGQSAFARAGRLGREIRALPAVQLSGNLSTDAIGKIIGVAGTGLDKLGISVAQFGVGAAAGTALTVGFVLAMEKFNKSIEGGVRQLEGALQAQNNYYKALSENTSAQVQAQRDQLQQSTEFLIAQRDETQRAIDSTFAQLSAQFGDAGARALIATGKTPIAQLETQLNTLNAQISVNTQTVTRYTQGLEQNAFLMEDIAAQQAAQQADAAQHLQNRSEAEAATLRFLENATKQATNERVATAQTEINRLLALNAELQASGGETAQKLIELNNQRILEQQYIRDTTAELRGAFDIQNDRRNAFAIVQDVVSSGMDRFTGGLERVGENFERLQPAFETISKITQEQIESTAKLNEIARQQSDAEAKALADRDKNRLENEYQLGRDLEDQAREHRRALIDINRRALNDVRNAEGERDALGAFLAEQRRDEEVREQKRNNKETVRDLNRNFKEQQRVIDQRYAEQLAAAKSAAERASEIERARLKVQVDALNIQLQNQQAAANAFIAVDAGTNAIILQGAIGLQNNLAELWGVWEMNRDATAAAEAYALQQSQLGLTGTQYGGRAYGGAVNSGQRVLVGEHGPEIAYFRSPAMVMSNRASRNGAGNTMTFNIDMTGVSDSQFVSKATRVFHTELNKVYHAAKQKRGLA